MNVFFYDGYCPFCLTLALKLKKLNLNRKISILSYRDFSEKELKQFHPDLNYDLLQGNVQFIFEKKRYPGFFGIRKLSFYLKGYRYFFWILYFPLIPFLGIFFLYLFKRFKS